MKAYKCDVCGKYCDDVFSNSNDIFDIFHNNARELGLREEHINIREMCKDCFEDIQKYIFNKYLENHKAGVKND